MKILVINGPNLNMLGYREPEIYGTQTLDEINAYIEAQFDNIQFEFFQSNCEGEIISKIHASQFEKFDGAVINPGAYSHYSYAIYDAIKSVTTPFVEVHLSKIEERKEEWRKVSVTALASKKMISGKGIMGYIEAVEYFLQKRLAKIQ